MANSPDQLIRIAAVNGSVRPGNFTGRVLDVVLDELDKQPDVEYSLIDPAALDLRPTGMQKDTEGLKEMQATVSAAAGIILATPEYHGSYSSAMKLVIDNLDYPSALQWKPVALLGCASGGIGAVKALEHLRSVCSHVGALVLPGPVSVSEVHKLFDDQGHIIDARMEERIRGVATHLVDYIRTHLCPQWALEEMVRQSSD